MPTIRLQQNKGLLFSLGKGIININQDKLIKYTHKKSK